MKDETRRDWQRVFELQRSEPGTGDDRKRAEVFQEIGRLQIGIVKRGKDKAELEAEIAKLEKETASIPDASDEKIKETPAEPARAMTPSPEPECCDRRSRPGRPRRRRASRPRKNPLFRQCPRR